MKKNGFNLGLAILIIILFWFVLLSSIPKEIVPVYHNVFGYTNSTLKELILNKDRILSSKEEKVVIGPLIILSIDQINHKAKVSPLINKNLIDSQTTIDIYYEQSKNQDEWFKIQINNGFYVEGLLKESQERGLYFEATVMHIAMIE